jgi:two-component system phosphate regulon sensor histidine kinase PhoR
MGLHTVKDGYLGPVNPAQGKSLETAAASLAYFQDMIRDYLDLSRLEKGEMTTQKTYFPLHQRVIEPVLQGLEHEIQARRMVIEDRIPAGKVVYADANLLRIVYNNLLSNAAKYGVEGGTIVLDLQQDAYTTVLSVRNDSQGIPPEQLARLFGKFSRLDDPEYTVKRGTGLGLYICKQIVESHGGKISADSKLGEWVEFRVTLRNSDV